MSSVTLSATPKGNGFRAALTFPNGVSIISAEAFATKSESRFCVAALKSARACQNALKGLDPADET